MTVSEKLALGGSELKIMLYDSIGRMSVWGSELKICYMTVSEE